MNEGSSPPKSVRTEALSFFSVEEVARARGACLEQRGRCARSRLAAVVGADACVRGDRGCRFGGRAGAACAVERFHPRAPLGLLDAAVALVGGRSGKGGRRQRRPHGRGPARAGRARPSAAGLVGSARRGCVRVRSTPPFVRGACRARTTVQPVFAAPQRRRWRGSCADWQSGPASLYETCSSKTRAVAPGR